MTTRAWSIVALEYALLEKRLLLSAELGRRPAGVTLLPFSSTDELKARLVEAISTAAGTNSPLLLIIRTHGRPGTGTAPVTAPDDRKSAMNWWQVVPDLEKWPRRIVVCFSMCWGLYPDAQAAWRQRSRRPVMVGGIDELDSQEANAFDREVLDLARSRRLNQNALLALVGRHNRARRDSFGRNGFRVVTSANRIVPTEATGRTAPRATREVTVVAAQYDPALLPGTRVPPERENHRSLPIEVPDCGPGNMILCDKRGKYWLVRHAWSAFGEDLYAVIGRGAEVDAKTYREPEALISLGEMGEVLVIRWIDRTTPEVPPTAHSQDRLVSPFERIPLPSDLLRSKCRRCNYCSIGWGRTGWQAACLRERGSCVWHADLALPAR